MNKKVIAVILAVVLVSVGAIGGTLAWLTDKQERTNTFTVGDINMELTHPNFDQAKAKLVPGTSIPWAPTITIKADSEDSYVFVMVENNLKANSKTIGVPNISSDWTAVATQGNKTIYKYKQTIASANTDTQLTSVFTTIDISGDVTAADMEAMELIVTKTLSVTAYAHQVVGQTENDALLAFEALLTGTWS